MISSRMISSEQKSRGKVKSNTMNTKRRRREKNERRTSRSVAAANTDKLGTLDILQSFEFELNLFVFSLVIFLEKLIEELLTIEEKVESMQRE